MTDIQKQPAKEREDRAGKRPRRGRRIWVGNQFGNTGKSTIAVHVIHARLGGRFYSIDSFNQDATQYGAVVRHVNRRDVHDMRLAISTTNEPVVVDLGTSDFTDFMEQMSESEMALSFDYVVIVSDTTRRGQEGAISTYLTLRDLGMPNAAFRIVLNKAVLRTREIPQQFPILFAYKQREPDFPLTEKCYIPQHGLFRALHESGQAYEDALNDKTEYEGAIEDAIFAGDTARAIVLTRRHFSQALARSMKEYFDRAFSELRFDVKAMRHDFPKGEVFRDDDLAPASDESVRYVSQIRKVNRVVVGLRELDASIGEKIRLAAGVIDRGSANLATTSENLLGNTEERAEERAKVEALIGEAHALRGTVEGMSRSLTDLESRLPDPKQVRLEILGDLRRAFDDDLLEKVEKVRAVLKATVAEAANELVGAAAQGFARPPRPAEGSRVLTRLNYRYKQATYQTRKFASRSLAVTLMIGVIVLVLHGVEFHIHGII